jgi:hypothetical protein
MSAYADGAELQGELAAFLTAFLESEEGAQACAAARSLGERARRVLRTVDPAAVVSVDFFTAEVAAQAMEDVSVEVELPADALHDLLLGRLDPVAISRLYETDELVFSGSATDLAALVVLAGALQPHYPASLRGRGRDDLLATPMPERHAVWTAGPDAVPRAVINSRRSWQRSRRAAAAT